MDLRRINKNISKSVSVLFLSVSICISMSAFVVAGITAVSAPVLSPAAPSPGEYVNVSWNYTCDYGPEPERYFLALYDQCTIPATGGGSDTAMHVLVGDACVEPTPGACLSCVSGPGCDGIPTPTSAGTWSYTKPVKMPSTLIPGYTYYIVAGMASYGVYMNPDLTVTKQSCVPFTVPLTAPYIKLNKVAEGTTGSVGTKVLFTIYYDAGNVHNFRITDAVDSRYIINTVYNGGTFSGQNITWTINTGYITSPVTGSVSFLATINSGSVGDNIPNIAAGSATELAGENSNNAAVAIGKPGLSIDKSASAAIADTGDTVTFYMQYINQGTTLVEYENFENGSVPVGWTSSGGTWTVNSGRLEQTGTTGYQSLMDSTMTPLHDGIYIADVYIPSSNTAHLDAVLHFIQVDGSNFYMARINASDNKLYLDSVVGGTQQIGQVSVANPHGLDILQDTWYTMKIQVCGSSIKMKVWPSGDNEYPAWDFNGSDSGIPGNGIFGFQSNEGPQQYDNMKIFSLTASTNPRIFDTVPVGIDYIGCAGGISCSKADTMINWTVGSTCAGAEAVSWYGKVTASCGMSISNVAGIDSDDSPPPVISNSVVVDLCVCTPTFI
ncbi:MAG: hypothetical protein LLG37_10485, partial [Spirochaetia bacterium]|nr:hypothetical protein [Spirochaetia bacterium]